jgi:hypothetical protein
MALPVETGPEPDPTSDEVVTAFKAGAVEEKLMMPAPAVSKAGSDPLVSRRFAQENKKRENRAAMYRQAAQPRVVVDSVDTVGENIVNPLLLSETDKSLWAQELLRQQQVALTKSQRCWSTESWRDPNVAISDVKQDPDLRAQFTILNKDGNVVTFAETSGECTTPAGRDAGKFFWPQAEVSVVGDSAKRILACEASSADARARMPYPAWRHPKGWTTDIHEDWETSLVVGGPNKRKSKRSAPVVGHCFSTVYFSSFESAFAWSRAWNQGGCKKFLAGIECGCTRL